ncbi:MAG TPA: branched-chain amino acid ABC transporter permease [Anaerolineaceae bacterium]|jgi:branched-chain amino acid transport system permease protein|nr:branched-chain amino acid ABC transporter permease [Anaerolineaceae bacterium]HOH20968.1 branched-chain amino acid ABC transporter permease [Anaerolineaceae bacterium]HOU44700.1 branched-chain amino acid ABC transporter permease [Anaerolineaceae bacterium]HQF46507.1 branched-chain amino acid ABC transporter permease [Anaerolineaceae bacterium]HQH36383.1 branched-chain amino acid ABC transporter permease [Anaerolineaceae bacterium]
MEETSLKPNTPANPINIFLKGISKYWGSFAVLGVFILFPFVFGWITGSSPTLGPSKYWQGQLITFFILAVYAMSYDLLIGYTGILSFGHAAFYGGGAYTMAIFYKHIAPRWLESGNFHLAIGSINLTEAALFIIAILLVCVVVILLGLLFTAVSARVKGVYFAMITLAIADALYILSKATDFVKWTGADEGLHGVPVPTWINPNTHRLQFYFIALGFAVLMYLILRRVVNSPTGRVMVAVRENESRVSMIGYNPAIYRSVAFLVSGLVAGLAGGLTALWNLGATPTMTSALTTINALIITILGGVGTLVGPIIGAGIMQLISQFFYEWFGARWPLVFGLLYIVLVMFLPYGIVGTWRMKQFDRKQGWKRFLNLFRTK